MDLEDSEATPTKMISEMSTEKEQVDAITAIMKTKQVARRHETLQVK